MPIHPADTGPDIVTAWTGFAPAAALLTSARSIEGGRPRALLEQVAWPRCNGRISVSL
jgi:hypothetical protein